MSTKTFNVSFPADLADLIDRRAQEEFGSRSDLLRAAAIKYLDDRELRETHVARLKEMLKDGKKYAKNSQFKNEEEVAEYITNERRKKASWRNSPRT